MRLAASAFALVLVSVFALALVLIGGLNIPRGGPPLVGQVSETMGLPRTPLLSQSPVTPYNPPSVNNPGERVMQSNQSFPLNGGTGNNSADRDTYVREHLNN